MTALGSQISELAQGLAQLTHAYNGTVDALKTTIGLIENQLALVRANVRVDEGDLKRLAAIVRQLQRLPPSPPAAI